MMQSRLIVLKKTTTSLFKLKVVKEFEREDLGIKAFNEIFM